MSELAMKYFVLKPKSNANGDPYAIASRHAMRAYANGIFPHNPELSKELRSWADKESDACLNFDKKK